MNSRNVNLKISDIPDLGIHCSGISSSVGRLLSGVLCDLRPLHPLPLTTGCSIYLLLSRMSYCPIMSLYPPAVVLLAALPVLGMSWVSTYSALLALACLFGLLTGVWIAATSPLLVR